MIMLRIILLASLAVVMRPAVAAPAEPTGKWIIDYSPTACTAQRSFGDRVIAITPSPLGVTTRIMVELPGKAARASHVNSAVDPADGQGAISTTSILFPSRRKGFRGIYTVLPTADAKRVLSSGKFILRTGNGSDRDLVSDRAQGVAGVDFDMGRMAALNDALATCMGDLRKHWNIVEGRIAPPPYRTRSRGDVRSIFRPEDYPQDASDRSLHGTSQFTLMIDDKGDVADCYVSRTSGVAVLDAMGCQVIRERAKFVPATDQNGKPTGDIYVTPPVRWALN